VTFDDVLPTHPLSRVLRAILCAVVGHGTAALKGVVRTWFTHVAQSEGVLWLPVSWNAHNTNEEKCLASLWSPLLLKVLKVVLQIKLQQAQSGEMCIFSSTTTTTTTTAPSSSSSSSSSSHSTSSPRGLVVCLLGPLAANIRPLLLKYYARVVNIFPFRLLTAPDPFHSEFTEHTSNPFIAITHALNEVNQEPIQWFLTTNLGPVSLSSLTLSLLLLSHPLILYSPPDSSFVVFVLTMSMCVRLDPRHDYLVCLQRTLLRKHENHVARVPLVFIPYNEPLTMGRGELLGIDDKKVSRKQALVVARRVTSEADHRHSSWQGPTLDLTPVSSRCSSLPTLPLQLFLLLQFMPHLSLWCSFLNSVV
jgi:hypothetical protein